MFTCSRILVVFDPKHDNQPAFERACVLASKMSAAILLVSCIYDETYDMTNFLTTDQRVGMKTALLKGQFEAMKRYVEQSNQPDVEIKPVWHKSMYRGVIDTAAHEHCDLIVKACKPHTKISQRLFTPNDWHLLRHSPVNVLLVKEHDWPQNGNIVAAISIDTNDRMHNLLSERISQISVDLANLVNGRLHLANTYAGAPVHIAIEVPSFNAQVYNRDVQLKHEKEMMAIAARHELDASAVHVSDGLPEHVIPQLCDSLDAELLILGSVGRKGISAALLGNTAEHIIDRINCDTLVIKPYAH